MHEDLLEKLVAEYYSSRPNLQMHYSPLCVFFLACSGSGKSTLRRLLVSELGATYVCNDEVRELIVKHPEANQLGIKIKDIVAKTVEKIFAEATNKLVIFDNNIIQYYMHEDSYLNVAKSQQRPVFIIGLEVSESELRSRITERGVDVNSILDELPGQLIDYEKAAKEIKPDWTLEAIDDPNKIKELVQLLPSYSKMTF